MSGTVLRPVKLSYEDQLGFPDDGQRHEILDGEHVVTPSPNKAHQTVSRRLLVALDGWASRAGAEVFSAPFDVVLSQNDVVQPDLLLVKKERLSILTESNVQGPPDLVVEILSESTRGRDEVTKRHLYERYGVEEYWLVDPLLATMKVLRGDEERFLKAILLSRDRGEILQSPLLPGFSLALGTLFA